MVMIIIITILSGSICICNRVWYRICSRCICYISHCELLSVIDAHVLCAVVIAFALYALQIHFLYLLSSGSETFKHETTKIILIHLAAVLYDIRICFGIIVMDPMVLVFVCFRVWRCSAKYNE